MQTGARVGALDGLRGLALVAVLVYHAAPDLLPGGFLGVEMFFVLSGFLLITLLLDEEERRGLIDPWAYAARRLRRIAPGLLLFLGILAVAAPLIAGEDAHRLPADIVSSALGLTNWHLIADGSSYFAQTGRPSLVRHLWSIAVELQVYVAIPFIAALLARSSRFRATLLLIGGITTSATVMALLYVSPDPSRAYFGTDSRLSAMLSGALVAVLIRRRRDGSRVRVSSPTGLILSTAGGAFLAVALVVADERARALYPAGFLAVQAATGAVIVAIMSGAGSARALADPRLRWLGRRSYGIYLWHWPIVALFRPGIDVDLPTAVVAPITIGAAILAGAASYRYVEAPFLQARSWGRRPLPRMTRVGALAWVVSATAVIALIGRSAPVDPITESLLAGEAALAEQEPITPVPTVTEAPSTRGPGGVVAEPAVKPAPPPKSKGPAPGSITLSAVGDSVMLGAAAAMKDRFGSKSYINAEKNRRWREGATVVGDWRKAGRLGRVLVAHLGNNGPAKAEEIEATLKEAKPTEHILLVNVRVSKPWQKEVNQLLRKIAEKHAKVWLVDWHAASSGHRDWFYSDGTHMTRKGAEAYTKLLAAKIPPLSKETPTAETSKPKPKATPTPGLVEGVLQAE